MGYTNYEDDRSSKTVNIGSHIPDVSGFGKFGAESKLEQIGFYSLSDKRAQEVSAASQMKRCEMIITEYCNFKCPYCRGLDAAIYGERKRKELSISEIKNNIDLWCEKEPLENIRFSGGEPTLHKDIIEVVRYARFKGIKRIAISSNGSSNIKLYQDLIKAGCNDFSISLDACCSEDGDKMAGGINGSWDKVVQNIEQIAKLTYVTVGIVINQDNIDKTIDTVRFAHKLGVADIRIITAAQYNKPIPRLYEIEKDIIEAHPILKYRVDHFAQGKNVRGIQSSDCSRCYIVLDDSVIAGDYHYPCVIYMREQGQAIGKVGTDMRKARALWHKSHDTHKDPICAKNCLDVCIDHNNKCAKFYVR